MFNQNIVLSLIQQNDKDMENYTNLKQSVTFANGKSFTLYSKMTKRGVRYFYWSGDRFFPISKTEAGVL